MLASGDLAFSVPRRTTLRIVFVTRVAWSIVDATILH